MIRIGTATDDDDDDEWGDARSTVRGRFGRQRIDAPKTNPPSIGSSTSVFPRRADTPPCHRRCRGGRTGPIIQRSPKRRESRWPKSEDGRCAIVRGSDVHKLHAGGISTDALVSMESTRELCLKGVSMGGPIVHDRGLSPLFLNARMFSGRSMQPCPHNCIRSLHELVKNQMGLTN